MRSHRDLRGASLRRVDSQGIAYRRLRNQKVIIETQLERPFNATEKQALKMAVERYGDFLQMPSRLI